MSKAVTVVELLKRRVPVRKMLSSSMPKGNVIVAELDTGHTDKVH